MLTEHRKSLILDTLRRDGQVLAKQLARELELSEDTIRRDLRELASEGRLQRVHGGALPAAPALPDYPTRQTIAKEEKVAVGRLAVSMIEKGFVVFLDGGTTCGEIARQIPPERPCTIITHAPTIAVALADKPEVTVELIGGRLYRHSMVATGVHAAEAIGQIRADIYFMGVTGVHPIEGFTTGDREEAAIKRVISEVARRTMVLMTAEKADAVSPYRIIGFDQATGILAGPDVPGTTVDAYRRAGADVRVA